MSSLYRSDFNWKNINGFKDSESSRKKNMMKVWTRPTIGWKLDCDIGLVDRQSAYEIFSMRLDTLGFMDYIMWLSVIVVLLVFVPFIYLICNRRGSDAYCCFKQEPFVIRFLILACFLGMMTMIETERAQAHGNIDRVHKFAKTNSCGDEYSKIDTYKVLDRLSKADATLDGMMLAIWVGIGFVCVETLGLMCHYMVKRK